MIQRWGDSQNDPSIQERCTVEYVQTEQRASRIAYSDDHIRGRQVPGNKRFRRSYLGEPGEVILCSAFTSNHPFQIGQRNGVARYCDLADPPRTKTN